MQGNGNTGYGMPPMMGAAGGAAAALEAPREKKMTAARLRKATETLKRYQAAKAAQDQRVIENEKWYRQRHWEYIQGNGGDQSRRYQTKSAWLFNALNILHSDAMDAYPRLNVLPREQGDEEEATRLSSILPVVMEQNDFREVYDENTWRKGRSGTGVYGIFWNREKLRGLGDIDIQPVDVLNLFWEHGKTDLQKSANVFHVEMIEKEWLLERYPQLKKQGLGGSGGLKVREYEGEDRNSQDGRVAVIDWYYKAWNGQKSVLHYCKYVNTTVLYASEDDWEAPEGKEPPAVRGWYDHGLYPFEVDAFYPMEGTCAGFGLIDVNKSAQEQIDLMNSAIVTNACMRAFPRYFRRNDGGINDADLLDWTKVLIGYDGASPQNDLMPIEVPEMPGVVLNVLQSKIEELKTTSGSTDAATGKASAGVTAYSALAALIETAGKNTKAFSAGSYRAMRRVGLQVIELIRQYYDLPRQFRITGQQGENRYVTYSNEGLQQRSLGAIAGQEMYSLPEFDLHVSAEKDTTYTRLAQNELAKELMGMGVFSPQAVDQSLMMLDMMDFDGKEELEQKIRAMGDMAQRLAQFQQIALGLAQQYDPAMAEQIANMIMQGAAGPQTAAAPIQDAGDFAAEGKMRTDPITGVREKEHPNGAKARGVVDNATRPE